mgnify:CR=1 FL=1|tara:strand:+ start:3448 stop:4080 length:633 start_codon:yes stop_codon:yes gene_type:complete
MAKFRIENIMNIKFALFVITLLFCIWLGLIIKTENSFLNPSGNRNPANQKLMVVDQDSGEISFIQKSLQGVNAQILADDSVILKKIEDHEKKIEDLVKWNGHRYGEIEGIWNDYAKNSRVKAVEDDIKDFKKGNSMTALRGSLDSKIGDGQFVAFARDGDRGCGGRGCRAVTGFKQVGRDHGSEEPGWRDGDHHFSHGESTRMRIWKNTK